MRETNGTYRDIALLDLGDGGYATLTADDVVAAYGPGVVGLAAAERAVREYRLRHGRNAADGGPLDWPQRHREFCGDPWQHGDKRPTKPKGKGAK